MGILPRLLIRSAISIAAIGTTAFYLTRRRLNEKCPRIPYSALPEASACRNLIDSGQATPQPAWGLPNSRLVPSWPDADGDDTTLTHWIPSFAAVQVEIPASLLSAASLEFPHAGADNNDRSLLADVKKVVAAFLNARAAGVEPWILDRDVPPLEFTPGHHLFGTHPEPGAFLLGLWRSEGGVVEGLDPAGLPRGAPRPVAAFPSNAVVLGTRDGVHDSAGLVLYWMVAGKWMDKLNRASAALYLPGHFMQGGFQEFIVERVEEKTVRVTYVSVEASQRKVSGRLPWLLYEMHVMYAQSLLLGAVRRLRLSKQS
ncbi:hypothetical protein B0T16DRAFT_407497 [Cercophora newfieldiana]|uniref:Uncharacterized protein n=1 Tax=Cercophora newfieldiana TaxID=92897 RepID=A0AA39YIA7_9PEZI|nr:hypothetical protein B0T16DRAFT_407497 [Cercophora newfieldiana]